MVRAFALLLCATACAGSAREAREHTYPPDFRYIDRAQLRGAMGQMARDIIALDELFIRSNGAVLTPADQTQVLRLLRDLEKTAEGLGGAQLTNHPMLDERLPNFRRDLESARRAAEADPPSYYLAGTISGSCLHCHGPR